MAAMRRAHSCFLPRRRAAWERERGSASARTLDRLDRLDDDGDDDDGDDDDGDDGDDYNDKRIMVDDAPLRYTRLTAKQRRMLL
jgi:hypothetical protein